MAARPLAQILEGHVRSLALDIGERNVFRPPALKEAANYVDSFWRGLGYAVHRQSYDCWSIPCSNLEVTCRGKERPDELLLIGAHYDTVSGSPGANDNASGVAVLLELSRLVAGARPGCSLRFVAFVNEEPPFFRHGKMGSQVYAQAAHRRGDRINLMMSLETIGYYNDAPGSQGYPPLFRYFYPDRGDFLAFVSNLTSRRLLRRAVTAFRAHSGFPVEQVATFSFVPGVSWSDHLPFWRHGYKALMVTDTAFYRYAHYHRRGDTPEKLNYPALAQVTAGLHATILELASVGS